MSERDLFIAALRKQDPTEREAYLAVACGADSELRQRVEGLLQLHAQVGSFLQEPVVELLATRPQSPDTPVADHAGGTVPTDRAGCRIGPYKLLQKLGEGGMGAVWMAEQEQPVQRRVALKLIRAGFDSSQTLARFEAERQALALMDHPHIAKVLDGGATSEGRPYFVMELVKGVPVTDYCDQEHLTPDERLELFIPICRAVQHAHQKGVIHRDLKPSNILVTLCDGKPVAKVIDFGVAKATVHKLTNRTMFTEVGQIIGTLEYMAPEQAESNNLDIDTRADIYSLGVILYELLAGSPPFAAAQLRGATFTELLRLLREVEPPKPSSRLSSSRNLAAVAARRKLEPRQLKRVVHGELDWIVMKCLEKERGRRYETANGLALDLERYLADEPVAASPPSTAYRLSKVLRRYRGPLLATALVFVALTAAVAVSGWLAVRARTAEERADNNFFEAKQRADEAVAARRDLARTLADSYTTLGLTAGERNQPALATLWFAHAVKHSQGDPDREKFNRIRFRNWTADAFNPLRAVRSEEGIQQLFVHPDGRHLIAVVHARVLTARTGKPAPPGWDRDFEVWDLDTGALWLAPEGYRVFTAAAWSPDGTRLVVGTDGKAGVFEFPSGKPVQTWDHEGPVTAVAFSPDGTKVAFGWADVRVWDFVGQEFLAPPWKHAHPVRHVSFTPDAKRVVTVGTDLVTRVYELGGREPAFTAPNTSRVAPQFLEGGRLLLTTPDQDNVAGIDVATGKERFRAAAPSVAWSQTLTADRDGTSFWTSGQRLARRRGQDGTVVGNGMHLSHNTFSVAQSPDGSAVATASWDRTIRIWDVASESLRHPPLTLSTTAMGLAWFADGRRIAVGDNTGLIRVWSIPSGPPVRSVEAGGESSEAHFGPGGRYLVPHGAANHRATQRPVRLLDPATLSPAVPPIEPDGVLLAVDLAPNNRLLATATTPFTDKVERRKRMHGPGAGKVQLWELPSGRAIGTAIETPSEPRSVRFHPNGLRLAVFCATGEILTVDSVAGLVRGAYHPRRVGLDYTQWIHGGMVAYSPDGRRLYAYGPETYGLMVLDPETGRELYRFPRADVWDVRESPDGAVLAVAFEYSGARTLLLDPKTGEEVAPPLHHPEVVMGVRFDRTGSRLLTSCADGISRLWDWKAARLLAVFSHADRVFGAEFFGDGELLATCSTDQTARIWAVETGQPITPPIRLGGRGITLDITPDGRYAAIGGHAKKTLVLDLPAATRPADGDTNDLIRWAELLAGQRIDATGGVVNLTADDWLTRWREHRSR